MIYFAPIACAGIKFSNFEISDFVPADGHVRCSRRDFGTSGEQLAKLKVRSIPRMACARKKRVCLRAIVLVADRALSRHWRIAAMYTRPGEGHVDRVLVEAG